MYFLSFPFLLVVFSKKGQFFSSEMPVIWLVLVFILCYFDLALIFSKNWPSSELLLFVSGSELKAIC